ncbi:heat shock protein Hsp70E [Volvox carteri f. nagariensis]|uniref:Heat shock protein Hsp70E n=1 Tax=Volvox carteri f. nagariensis TaxID=3068 RepID=D8TSS9_VOLCA|nr:heat shock protein Hsp70E [Volvox carteri f. nagariensis]EFJ49538.1 heat shock protein Hsp70E [Volvox carteri f. nagariensis]|eukprot:XP_002949519.1 heat shock protein Hsp70E [Volvox carteri f. nagariensis]
MALVSVVGFDVGNDTSCVALARKRGIDVIMNKESKRETPAAINFGEKMRFLGTDGAAKLGLQPQNTVHQLKRILGKKFQDPLVQADIAKLPFAVLEGPDGGCLIKVRYCNEDAIFTPEQVMAMILVDLKRIAEAESGIPVTDCALSVPTYFTEAERYAMLNAAQIAGVNCLRLINETTATALAYGIYKTDLPEADPVHVVFVDVGHSHTQVSVVSLLRSKLVVKSHAWDRNLGGRDFDEVLFDHFAAEFKAKTKLDIRANKKASFKLRTAVEKVKKTLSANSEVPLNVECIFEDEDLRGMMTREHFEQLAEPILARLRAPMEDALRESKLSVEDISSVEVVGSCTRMPAVCRIVEEVFKKAPSRTMNSKECVSRGAALQCAMLSPVFKVREFEVVDAAPLPVCMSWEGKDGAAVTQVLFARGEAFPSSKMISFNRSQPFTVRAHYALDTPPELLPPAFDKNLGVYTIGPFQVPAGAETAKLKVKVELNLHGLIQVQQVQSIEETEEEAPAPASTPTADVKMDEAAAAAAASSNGNPAASAPARKKKVKKTDVPFQASSVCGYSKSQLDDYFEKEHQMQAADRLQEETNERKNALEGYVYDLRNKLYDAYAPYIKEADKEVLQGQLTAMEDWLYDEGEDTTKSVYIAKLDELKAKGAPVERRYAEDQTRGSAVEGLRSTLEHYRSLARSDRPQYAHISPEERATVLKECDAAQAWLDERLALQANLTKADEPALLTADINKKRDTVERACKPIMSKPAPPPPTPPPAAASPAAEPEPMESEATPGPEAGSAPEAEAAAGAEASQPMETGN